MGRDEKEAAAGVPLTEIIRRSFLRALIMNFYQTTVSCRILLGCWLCLLASGLGAQTEFDQYISDTAERWKNARQAILDDADMVASGTQRELERLLVRFEDQTGIAVAVVTLPGLKGGQLEDFTTRLYERAGLGTAGQDRGVLLLVARQERSIRIETGYGSEGDLTDLEAKLIIDTVITPAFRSGNFSGGIENGVKAILNELQPGFTPAPAVSRSPPGGKSSWLKEFIIFILIMAFLGMRMFSPFRRRRYRRGRGGIWLGGAGGFGRGGGFGGGGGGGFGGFGGGMSGGGGASGGW